MSRRILQVLPSAEVGGAERLAVALAQELVRQSGSDIGFLVPGEGSTAELVRAADFPIRSFSMRALMDGSRRVSLPEALRIVLSARLSRFQLLHLHAPFLYGALAPACRIAGVESIVHVHLDYGTDSLRWALRHPPAAVVVCADYLRAQVTEALPAAARRTTPVVTVRNAIDVTRFKPGDQASARDVIGQPGSGFALALIGNLAPHKGQHVAIEALTELRRRGRDATLWIVGTSRDPSDGYRDQLAVLAHRSGCGDFVKFLGQRSDVPQVMQAADAVLLPSMNEGMPLVILEAQSCGTPVLAAPTAGIPEIVENGKTGLLVRAEDVQGYVRGIEWMIEHPEKVSLMVAAARERVLRSHTSDAYARQIARLYDSLDRSYESGRPGKRD